jgi:hypothetical protein
MPGLPAQISLSGGRYYYATLIGGKRYVLILETGAPQELFGVLKASLQNH